ncbi:MAG TPA: GNAT family N-acetyltransferase [Gemmatimonadales bacterium]|nr:GNAT family N-acetyltransferase [Gemmatimonadales bacterium]
MMWRPDRSVRGPDRATMRDVDALNRVFAEAFTDRYSRDGLVGVRVPQLNPAIWRYAIEDAGDGAMVWRDTDGQLAGFNMVHRSGIEGWMGPIAVRPDRQNEGLGSTMVQAGIDWLKAQGARTIGLETMPRTVDNIGFYSRLGFMPGHLTITLVRDVGRRTADPGELLSSAGDRVAAELAECRALSDRLAPGIDFTRELALTHELRIGDTSLIRRDGRLTAFALWHSAPLAAGRPKDEVRVLKLVAASLDDMEQVVDAVQHSAQRERVRRVALRCQSAFADAYLRLVERGFRVHWTDLRMILRGFANPGSRAGLLLSNWEI